MNTNETDFGNGDVSVEAQKLKSELLVREAIISGTRDRYAEEIGNKNAIDNMRMLVSSKPKTYKLPKSVRSGRNNRLGNFINRIKVLFGLDK